VKAIEAMSEKDALLTRISYDLAALADTAVMELPVSTQNIIEETLKAGGHLGVAVILNPWPYFVFSLLSGPDAEPIELCRCSPSSGALRTPSTSTH
jgi:hypothetical protein